EAVAEYSSTDEVLNRRTYWRMIDFVHDSINIEDEIDNTRVRFEFLRDAKILEISYRKNSEEKKHQNKESHRRMRFTALSIKAKDLLSRKPPKPRGTTATLPATAAEGKPTE